MKLRQLIGVSGTLRHHLIRGASGSLVLKITNTALTLLMAVVLARMLGVENFVDCAMSCLGKSASSCVLPW